MSQRCYDNIKRLKPQDTQLGILRIYVFLENLAEGQESRRERWWSFRVSVFENTPKNLVDQGRLQFPQDFEGRLWKKVSLRLWNTGMVSSRASLTSLGEGAFLTLVGHPSSDGVTIKMLMG